MGIFKDERVLFNNNQQKDYTINSVDNNKFSNDALAINIAKRCDISQLYKIIVKDVLVFFGIAFMIALLGELVLQVIDDEFEFAFISILLLVLCLVVYSVIYYKSFYLRDNLINEYVERKIEFYEIIYHRLYEKYRDKPEKYIKFREYIDTFPKRYKIYTAYKQIFGYSLIWIIFFGGLIMIIILSSYMHIDTEMFLISMLLMLAAIVMSFFIFIMRPLKIRNDIWYNISLFEKEIVDNIQQIIPDNDKNKKQVNYPVDCKLEVPFMMSIVLLIILNGLYYIVWDYLMVTAEKTYLSKGYLVEDYLASFIRDK